MRDRNQKRDEAKSTHAMTMVMLQAETNSLSQSANLSNARPMVRTLSLCYSYPGTDIQTCTVPDCFPIDKRAAARQSVLNNLPTTGYSEFIRYDQGDIDLTDEVQSVRDFKANRY